MKPDDACRPERDLNGSHDNCFLILDDEDSIRKSIAAYIEDEGYPVFQATSGEEALNIIRSHPITKAIVDIRLPGMDGDTFIVKAAEIKPDLRFVVHTGSSDYIPSSPVREAGITPNRIFLKPAQDMARIIQALT